MTEQKQESVNVARNITHEVNTYPKIHLSKQMRLILQCLYVGSPHGLHEVAHGWQQVEIISTIYPQDEYLTLARIASLSRSMKTLMKAGLVESRTTYYSNVLQDMISQRVHYYITEKGKQFVQSRLLKGESSKSHV